MLDKLDALQVRFKEIEQEMNQPDVMQDMKRYIKLSKDYKDMQPIMVAYKEYRNLLSNIENAKEVLNTEKDEENGQKVRVMYIKDWYARILLADGTTGYMNKRFLN